MIRRRTFLGSVTASSLAVIAGCTDGNTTGGATVEETSSVSMTGSQFDPRNIHVGTGTTVTWSNDDTVEHTVTSASDNWSKDTSVPGGEQTTHTFDESGVYDVYCSIHGGDDLSGMSMKVGVGDATIDEPLGSGSDDGGGGAY